MSQSKPHAVAAGHPQTAAAARQILLQGGQAFDAILAAMMMSFVSEPLLASPGGGGFLLAAGPDQPPRLLDFFSDTPTTDSAGIAQDGIDFYPIEGNFGTRSQEFHIGHAAAAVPGVPAGIHKIHQQLCSLPLEVLAQPAIDAARSGVVVNHQQAFVAMVLQPIINATPAGKKVYGNMRQGQRWQNPELAEFLIQLCRQDPNWFYQGEAAAAICSQPDGLLQAIDFKDYECAVREPLQWSSNGYEVYTNPEPSSGGRLIVEQLKRLKSRHDFAAVLEAQQHADDLKRSQLFEVSRGTTHISVADGHGNLASLTLSNGENNGHVVPGCGFMMNNFLGEEDINPDGFMSWQGKERLRSMMSPTLITHAEHRYALGTGGSNRIKTALFQVINHIVNDRKILKHAIEAPRMHFENGHLDIEPGFQADDLSVLLKTCPINSEWHNHNLYFGGVNAVQSGQTTAAVADFRRNGCGLVFSY